MAGVEEKGRGSRSEIMLGVSRRYHILQAVMRHARLYPWSKKGVLEGFQAGERNDEFCFQRPR